ncbi:MAG: hypothetical protein P4L99_19875 [Chthoniobacter sp.]|nr:hypothetical protein [Chthoniobacter sp.]
MGVSLRGVESPADGHSPVDHERIAPKGFKSLRDVSKDRGALWGFATFGGPPLILFVCFLLIPVSAGQILGSAAVVLLGLASLGCFGAGILYFGHRYNLPTGLILIILAVCAHWTNDNHQIRHLDTPIVRRDLLEERLDAWHKHATDSDGSAKPTSENSKHPLFIVATEGGGIRAAYWTSLVLSGLEDFSIKQHERRFSDHLFAISGVSGGSFGGAAYTAFIADPKNGVSFADRTHAFLGQEYLGPLVGRMLFTDSLQRFCPLRVSHFDRASSFEIAWEEAWRGKDVHGDSPRLFSNGFAELYRDCSDRKIWLPGLFLNGTNVETGGRIITSSWDFKDADGSTFVNAIDGVTKMEAPLRMSTAAHSSARFTYFNPPGRYPDGTHVVDGGYFENSGGQTAHDILARVLRKMWSDPTWHDVEPHLIIIRNGLDVPSTPEAQAAAARRLRENHSLSELLAPLATLWNTRTAHAESSLRELEEQPILAATLNPHETAEKNEGNGSWTVFPHHEFFLLNESTSVPLGWALSNTAIEEMHRQFLQRERGQAVQSILTTLKFSYVGISQ